MKAIMKTAILAASVALIGGISAVSSGWTQQPAATPAPQAMTPAQPGPGMGHQMMQQGMEHGKAGQSMGQQMEQSHQQAGGHGMRQQAATTPEPGHAPGTL